ncbi:hypothetical protein J3B02_005791, partial [Coemansia erecta]
MACMRVRVLPSSDNTELWPRKGTKQHADHAHHALRLFPYAVRMLRLPLVQLDHARPGQKHAVWVLQPGGAATSS